MRCILGTVSEWIQALAALGIVFLTARTLIVLRGYAADTHHLANHSALQIENAQMPFLAITRNQGGQGEWVIANQGFGPAVNVTYHGFTKDEKPEQPNPVHTIAPREVVGFANHFIRSNRDFVVDYESLAGKKYRSIVTTAGQPRTDFQRL